MTGQKSSGFFNEILKFSSCTDGLSLLFSTNITSASKQKVIG